MYYQTKFANDFLYSWRKHKMTNGKERTIGDLSLLIAQKFHHKSRA
jgi:hypothetical protein